MNSEPVETIYFGGGTPSLLDRSEVERLAKALLSTFQVAHDVEITIETNPDDITAEKLKQWKKAGINRLSIGIQSFFQEDLHWMNRGHTAGQAIDSLELAITYFDNISIDLIYGSPSLTDENWKHNVDKCVALGIPHLSCYALTVEPKTPLDKMIRNHKTTGVSPERQSDQFLSLMQWMDQAGYQHYEISNFAKPGFRSRHNSAYWQGKKYIGVGPSAHSFNGSSRQWNVSNNNIYIDSIRKGVLTYEKEILTPTQKLNEYIMTSLRTIEGLDLRQIEKNGLAQELRNASRKFLERSLMIEEQGHLRLTRQGRLLADGIAAELFFDKEIGQIAL